MSDLFKAEQEVFERHLRAVELWTNVKATIRKEIDAAKADGFVGVIDLLEPRSPGGPGTPVGPPEFVRKPLDGPRPANLQQRWMFSAAGADPTAERPAGPDAEPK